MCEGDDKVCQPADRHGVPDDLDAPERRAEPRQQHADGQIDEVCDREHFHVARAAQDAVYSHFEADEAEEKADELQIVLAGRHGLGRGGGIEEHGDDRRAEQLQKDAQQHGDQHDHPIGRAVALRHALRLLRADVLRRVGGQGIADGGHGHDTQRFDARRSGKAREDLRAEAVDHGLHEHHADGDRGLLQDGRQGHARHGAQLSEAEQTVRALRDAPQLQQEHAERQHGGQALRQKRGIGCAGHAPVQHGDEIPVQHDIQQRGKNQEIQRDTRFSERIEQGGQDIIEEEKGQTIEIDVQIGDCDLQRVGRSLQGGHDLLTAQQPDASQQDADGQKRQQGGVDGGLHAGKALCAEMLADDDGGADAAADGHAYEDRCERGGRADGGQRRFAVVVADDCGVHDGIGLLEEVSNDHRQGEFQKRPRGPFGDQIVGSGFQDSRFLPQVIIPSYHTECGENCQVGAQSCTPSMILMQNNNWIFRKYLILLNR